MKRNQSGIHPNPSLFFFSKNGSFPVHPLKGSFANPENPQKEKAIKLQAIHLPYGSIFSFYITFKILNFCYATIF